MLNTDNYDAADEVERLRDSCRELTRRHDECHAERDASRTAHAALVADLRALCDRHDPNIVLGVPDKPLRTPEVPIADVRALLDRHAPKDTDA